MDVFILWQNGKSAKKNPSLSTEKDGFKISNLKINGGKGEHL